MMIPTQREQSMFWWIIIIEMSYKANVDIVIALNALKITSFRKQGRLRFRLSLLRSHQPTKQNLNQEPQYCTPYNIYKSTKEPPPSLERTRPGPSLHIEKEVAAFRSSPLFQPSLVDHEQECYYSRIMESKYQAQSHKIQECVYFRSYMGVEELDTARFLLKAELLFAPQGQENFIQAGTYEATVHKVNNICTFLPVIFDQFGGFTISGVYQSTILEYRFESTGQVGEYGNFCNYLQAATKGCTFRLMQVNRQCLRQFYEYYRSSLESELFHIQERHSDLLRILNVPANYGFIKVGPNVGLMNLMMAVDTGNGLSRSRSREHLWGVEDIRDRLTDEITSDFNGLKGLIYQKWNEYVVFLGQRIDQLTEYFKAIYDSHVRERLKSHVFSHQVQPRFDWTYSRYQDSGKELLKQAEMDKQKQKDEQLWREWFPIQNKDFFQEQGKTIKIFEEIYQVNQQRRTITQHSISLPSTRKNSFDSSGSNVSYRPEPLFMPSKSQHELIQSRSLIEFAPNQRLSEKVVPEFFRKPTESELRIPQGHKCQHIVIFVHGYQASRQDFALFKSCLQVKYRCRVFISSANQGKTEESIQCLGKRLAIELNGFFKNVEFGPGTRLSFIGHSMGGIIIRSALTFIRNIEQYLWAYLSFSSPHLGYLYEPSALVQAGLWLLGTLQKSDSLDQLCMRDSQDPRRTFLYRLTENRSLQGFKHLGLISSSQDQYVPYESARIQKNSYLLGRLGQSISGSVIRQMVDNLIGQARCSQISRINVVFNIDGNNFDSLVGRTAHVKYLSDQKFIKMFTTVFDKFFS